MRGLQHDLRAQLHHLVGRQLEVGGGPFRLAHHPAEQVAAPAGHLAGAIPPERLIQVYIPEIYGKERRKTAPSAEGKLGVEGMPPEILLSILEQAGLLEDSEVPCPAAITKADLYRLGLSGGPGSAEKRRALCRKLNLPQGLSANALPGVLARLVSPEELETLAAGL